LEIQQYIQFLERWLWWIILCAILAGAGAFMISTLQPTTYRATTTVLFSPDRPARDTPNLSQLEARRQLANLYIVLLRQRPIFQGVIDNLQLEIDPGTLSEEVDISTVPDTYLIQITAEMREPDLSAAVANEMVQVFNQQEAALLANPFAQNQDSLQVLERAVAPPQQRGFPLRHTLMGAVAGMMIGIGGALFLAYLDETVRSSRDIKRLTGLGTVIAVPRLRGKKSAKIVTLQSKNAHVTNAYKMIRAYIEFAADEQPVRSVTITSGTYREGKSVISANLAVALAKSGLRVILIDGNPQNPMQHTLFRQSNEYGLSTFLQSEEWDSINDYLLATDIANLQLFPSGPDLDDTTSCLYDQYISRLVIELHAYADLVILDGPPLLEVFDTTPLMNASDAAILVVRAGRTTESTLLRAYDHARHCRARLLGVALNFAASQERNSYSSPDVNQHDASHYSASSQRLQTNDILHTPAPKAPSRMSRELYDRTRQ
jgi:capsular exopolysaccharide synthesis family protein